MIVGNGDTPSLHHPACDFNDETIPYGISYWVKLAETALRVSKAPGVRGMTQALHDLHERVPFTERAQRAWWLCACPSNGLTTASSAMSPRPVSNCRATPANIEVQARICFVSLGTAPFPGNLGEKDLGDCSDTRPEEATDAMPERSDG